MDYMFLNANAFTGDLSGWKACKIPTAGPEEFGITGVKSPKWNVCS